MVAAVTATSGDQDRPDLRSLQADQTARRRRARALIAAARADRRDRVAAELARTDELLAQCDAAAEAGGHPLLALARQLADEHHQSVEALAALVDAPDEERPQLLAAIAEHDRRKLEALTALAGLQVADDPSDRPRPPDPWDRPRPGPDR